jgi:membrane-associated phospholipid phosphatase
MERSIWNQPWFLIPVLLFYVLALVVTLWAPYGYELIWFNPHRVEPWNTFFIWATRLGEAPLWVAAAVILLFVHRPYGIVLITALLLMAPISYVAKDLIGIPRPNTWFDLHQLQDLLVKVPGVPLNGGNTSFPSGHTMLAFTMFSLVALMLPGRWRHLGALLALLAWLTGVSRIFLVQHFLRDILAGAAFGLAISSLVWFGYNRWLNKKKDTVSDNPSSSTSTNE